jgi:hypothetical protein
MAMSYHFRAKEGSFLDEQQMRRAAPSIYAVEAHSSRSDQYDFLPTIDIMRHLYREGDFVPVAVSQSKSRDSSRREHTKHMVRMRPRNDVSQNIGEVRPEIVVVNAHDGTSMLAILAGMFRLICSNGMIVADGPTASFRVKHMGHVLDEALIGASIVMAEAKKRIAYTERMRERILTIEEYDKLCDDAYKLRITGEAELRGGARTIAYARRREDQGNDLWHTFNRIQENVIKGGQTTYNPTTRGRNSTREITGITQNVDLNRDLWNLAVGYLENA